MLKQTQGYAGAPVYSDEEYWKLVYPHQELNNYIYL